MEINNKKELVKLIQSSDYDTGLKVLDQYHDILAEHYINAGWDKARRLVRFIGKNRKERIRKEMVNFDEESGMISLLTFTRFFAAVEDIANVHYNYGKEETKDAISDIVAQMYNLLGSVKIDRRIIFTKED